MVQCPGKPERKDIFGILHPAPFFLDMVSHVHLQINDQLEMKPCFMLQAGGAKHVDPLQMSREVMEGGNNC